MAVRAGINQKDVMLGANGVPGKSPPFPIIRSGVRFEAFNTNLAT